MKFTSALKLKLIYVFRINDAEHKGCLKIGEATSDNDNIREMELNTKFSEVTRRIMKDFQCFPR